jgi:hypothetical protein
MLAGRPLFWPVFVIATLAAIVGSQAPKLLYMQPFLSLSSAFNFFGMLSSSKGCAYIKVDPWPADLHT